MIRQVCFFMCFWVGALSIARAQQPAADTGSEAKSPSADVPTANPGRPTVATPATLTPVGYVQFETGFLSAWESPEFSSQSSFNEVIKFSVSRWIELLATAEPFAHSNAAGQPSNAAGGAGLGVQAVVHHGEGANPTVALGYLGSIYSGDAPDIDIGSVQNSALVLVSADVKGFHYDANLFFNEAVQSNVRRAQFGQTLSISHPLPHNFGLAGEIWHFTQPYLRGNCVGNLWALSYNARKNLVLDVGFNHGLTSTSTQWAVVAGFTYLLPRRLIAR